MTNIIPFPTKPTVTTGNRVEQVIRRAKELNALRQGDTVTKQGAPIHVLQERVKDGKRQLLIAGSGDKQWVPAEPIHAQMPEHFA